MTGGREALRTSLSQAEISSVLASAERSPKAKQLRRSRGVRPGLEVDFGGSAGRLQGVVALADQVEDAAVVEVVAHDVGEFGGQGLRGGRLGSEIRDGDAGLGNAQAGAGAEPVLGGGRRGGKNKCESTDEHR